MMFGGDDFVSRKKAIRDDHSVRRQHCALNSY